MTRKSTIPIEPGFYYHIYNHSNGNENIFLAEENYLYFLTKYKEYISPVTDTFGYCLMPNHFHLLVRFKEEKEIFEWLKNNGKIPDETLDLTGFKNLSGLIETDPFSLHISRQFSNFFNCYSKSINKQEGRMGSLFNRPFKRKKITSEKQLRDTLIYIHNNPVHHGFTENAGHWQHSSYHALLSAQPTMLLRDEVVNWFDDKENFIYCHKQYADVLIEEE